MQYMYSNTPQKDHVLEIRKLLWTLLSDYTFGNIADSRILIHNFLVRQESFLSTPIRHIHVHLEEVALSENQHEKHKLADFRLPLSFRMTEAVVVAVAVVVVAAAAAADDDDDDDDDNNYDDEQHRILTYSIDPDADFSSSQSLADLLDLLDVLPRQTELDVCR